jgi:hypothetical protein
LKRAQNFLGNPILVSSSDVANLVTSRENSLYLFMKNKTFSAWADSATQCIIDHRQTHELLIFYAVSEFSHQLCYAQLGAQPNLLNILMGNTPQGAVVAAQKTAEWVGMLGIDPQNVTIWRDGKLQLENSPLCSWCGGATYDSCETEAALVEALRSHGFIVQVVSCHTDNLNLCAALSN